jgi:ketosteroid isomerase-like protein
MSDTATTLAVVTRFENGFNARDIDATMADMAADAVFEHVAPAGTSIGRFEGCDAIRAVFASLDEHFPNFDLRASEIFAQGDRAACRWEISWDGPDGGRAHARGADIFRMRGDKIVEKLAYITF